MLQDSIEDSELEEAAEEKVRKDESVGVADNAEGRRLNLCQILTVFTRVNV